MKKTVIRIVLLTGTFISMFFVPWILVKILLTPVPDTIQEQVDKAIDYDLDGIIVYVDKAGEETAFYTAGWHDRANKIPARADAYFKIASISKLYDAVAITKLVHAGQLSLDKTLADYFPELEGRIENADKITLRMMVQHRSGIPNYTDTPNYWADPVLGYQAKLDLILDQPADFEPDAKYRYCNTNYLLIAELIEKTVGYSKFQYFKEEILDPLGLKNTFGSINEVDIDDVMSGYYVGIEEDLKTDDHGSKLTSMIATAQDVGTFLRALNDGSVFKEGEQEIYSSIYVYNHTGLIPGYQSIAKYHPEMDAVVVQFVNTVNFSGYTWSVHQMVYNRVVKIVRRQSAD